MKRWQKEHIDYIKETAGLLCGDAYKAFCERFPDFKASYSAFSRKKSFLGCCKAENKSLKWTNEMIAFVMSTKGQDRDKAYKAFCEKYEGITAIAFHNKRSRLGVADKKPHGPNRRAKLYEERVKGGYVMIKVAEPKTWKTKARWVWEETHPAELTAKTDQFIFLNGDTRDFRPENIERVEAKYRTLFLHFGGVDQNSEITRIRILQARIRAAQLDLGEKAGFVRTYGSRGRVEVKNVRKQRVKK